MISPEKIAEMLAALEGFLPLRRNDTEDYAEIDGPAMQAMCTRPDALMLLNDLPAILTELVAARSQLDALTAERDEARRDNERDRTIIIDARNAIHDAIVRRSWLLEGRGSYEWDDERYQLEFKAAIEEIGKPLETLERLGVNWANCPTDHDEIVAARVDWQSRALAAEAQLARQGASINLTDEMVVAAMEHVPGCDHDDMVNALEAALARSGDHHG